MKGIFSQSVVDYPGGRGGGGGGQGIPIYFLYRDDPTVRVSFSGSYRVYNFTFSCLKQGVPVNFLLFSPLVQS